MQDNNFNSNIARDDGSPEEGQAPAAFREAAAPLEAIRQLEIAHGVECAVKGSEDRSDQFIGLRECALSMNPEYSDPIVEGLVLNPYEWIYSSVAAALGRGLTDEERGASDEAVADNVSKGRICHKAMLCLMGKDLLVTSPERSRENSSELWWAHLTMDRFLERFPAGGICINIAGFPEPRPMREWCFDPPPLKSGRNRRGWWLVTLDWLDGCFRISCLLITDPRDMNGVRHFCFNLAISKSIGEAVESYCHDLPDRWACYSAAWEREPGLSMEEFERREREEAEKCAIEVFPVLMDFLSDLPPVRTFAFNADTNAIREVSWTPGRPAVLDADTVRRQIADPVYRVHVLGDIPGLPAARIN